MQCNDFNVFVLPVSGGKFPCQLEHMFRVLDVNVIPDVCISSSGGNVCSYIGLASNWKRNHMERVIKYFDSSVIVNSWTPLFPSWVFVLSSGTMFDSGKDSTDMFKKMFTKKSIQRTEIWTGTYNCEYKKTELFSNLSKEDSFFNCHWDDVEKFYKCNPPRYACGDISVISDYTHASASIPFITKPRKIFGDKHVDGGVSYASPMSVMSVPLINYINRMCKSLRLFYFSPYDMENRGRTGDRIIALGSLFSSSSLQDRSAALLALKSVVSGGELSYKQYKDVSYLKGIIDEAYSHKHSMLCLYPVDKVEIDMLCFDYKDVRSGMESSSNFNIHMWYGD